jgi:hypothetical protein
MRIYKRGFTLTIALAALVFTLTILGWSGSASQSSSPQDANKQEITPENDVPVLDLKEAEKAAPEQLKGRKRGQSLHQRIEELPAGPNHSPSHGISGGACLHYLSKKAMQLCLVRSLIAAQC